MSTLTFWGSYQKTRCQRLLHVEWFLNSSWFSKCKPYDSVEHALHRSPPGPWGRQEKDTDACLPSQISAALQEKHFLSTPPVLDAPCWNLRKVDKNVLCLFIGALTSTSRLRNRDMWHKCGSPLKPPDSYTEVCSVQLESRNMNDESNFWKEDWEMEKIRRMKERSRQKSTVSHIIFQGEKNNWQWLRNVKLLSHLKQITNEPVCPFQTCTPHNNPHDQMCLASILPHLYFQIFSIEIFAHEHKWDWTCMCYLEKMCERQFLNYFPE